MGQQVLALLKQLEAAAQAADDLAALVGLGPAALRVSGGV